MEKIDLLIWDDTAAAAAKSLEVPGLRSLQVSVAADLAGATLLLGKGPTLRGYAEIWSTGLRLARPRRAGPRVTPTW